MGLFLLSALTPALIPFAVDKNGDLTQIGYAAGVLGSGFSLSRGRAAELIAAGRVSLNGCECLKPDRQLAERDILSVRGQGRLILREIGGLSKKGRFYITVERFGG